jgi:hypothetical protein
MKIATVQLESRSPIAFGKFHATPKITDAKGRITELSDEYEQRTWREKLHYDKAGNVNIPAFAMKNCLSNAAKFISKPIPGKGKSTYTKHIQSGVLITDPLPLGVHKDKVAKLDLFVPSDGMRGGSKRVMKAFPMIDQWQTQGTIYILDEVISEDVLYDHLEAAGDFIGLGSLRVQNNGIFGRFKPTILKIEEK